MLDIKKQFDTNHQLCWEFYGHCCNCYIQNFDFIDEEYEVQRFRELNNFTYCIPVELI